jgi:hypothetical protein
MTESPTTAIPPRGPGVSMNTETKLISADAGCGATTSPPSTIAMTTEIARIRMRAQ